MRPVLRIRPPSCELLARTVVWRGSEAWRQSQARVCKLRGRCRVAAAPQLSIAVSKVFFQPARRLINQQFRTTGQRCRVTSAQPTWPS